ncbi:hypothetical protein GCM10010520_18130 [Rhizobium viscosum]
MFGTDCHARSTAGPSVWFRSEKLRTPFAAAAMKSLPVTADDEYKIIADTRSGCSIVYCWMTNPPWE